MTVVVRNAVMGDKQRCLDLLVILNGQARLSGEGFTALLSLERGQIIVAQEGDEILGMASVSYNLAMRYEGEYCQLEELVVDSSARGKNVGGLLMQQVVDNARKRGCREGGLYLLERTEHNKPFYEKYGFEVVGTEMRQRFEQG